MADPSPQRYEVTYVPSTNLSFFTSCSGHVITVITRSIEIVPKTGFHIEPANPMEKSVRSRGYEHLYQNSTGAIRRANPKKIGVEVPKSISHWPPTRLEAFNDKSFSSQFWSVTPWWSYVRDKNGNQFSARDRLSALLAQLLHKLALCF